MKKRKLKKELKNKDAILACAREFNMVGDPTRLKICYLLCRHKKLSVGEIADIIGISISVVSHTLCKLKNANMVEKRREFRTVYYRLIQNHFADIIRERLRAV